MPPLDTLSDRAATGVQPAHPVLEVLRRRRAEGSRPGARTDGRRVALVIEGGGMRGVVSAGMAAALEQLGYRNAFDEVHGASAGAFNAAFLLAGQAAYGCALYADGFGDPSFVGVRRWRRSGAVFDMDYIVNEVWRTRRPLRVDAILAGGIELHCTATDVDRAEVVDLWELRSDEEIRAALRASTRLPWLAGPPVHFRGLRLVDATLAESIPVAAATASATDVLVLQTRPAGVPHSPPSPAVAWLTERYLSAINPGLVELHRTRSRRYDELTARLAEHATNHVASPALWVVRPPVDSTVVGHMERRSRILRAGGLDGLRAAWLALEGEDPEVASVPLAFPQEPVGQRSSS